MWSYNPGPSGPKWWLGPEKLMLPIEPLPPLSEPPTSPQTSVCPALSHHHPWAPAALLTYSNLTFNLLHYHVLQPLLWGQETIQTIRASSPHPSLPTVDTSPPHSRPSPTPVWLPGSSRAEEQSSSLEMQTSSTSQDTVQLDSYSGTYHFPLKPITKIAFFFH